MSPEDTYELLRNLTSPIIALTSTWRGRHNGMITDSVIRASLSLRVPRIAVVIHRWNWSHDLVLRSGAFVLHLLHREQWDVVRALGFESGRERDKMVGLRYRLGRLGRPVLTDCYAYLECRVANVMDVGGSTMFLGDVVEADRGPGAEVMTAAYFRANQPAEWRAQYVKRLKAAQAFADAHATPLLPFHWTGPEEPQS